MKTRILMEMPEVMQEQMGFDTDITAVAELSADEFALFLENNTLPEQARARLRYTEAITKTPTSSLITGYKSMLVTTPGNLHGLAVCGGDYAYRSGLFPNAREWLDRRVHEMADSICKLYRKPNETQKIKLSRIGEVYDAVVTADNGMADLLAAELELRQEVTDCIISDDCLQINYALNYGQNPLDTPGEFLSIARLIGCDLEDFHFVHTDEEHELATVVELNADTLTEQGKRDWADVLAAKIERIYQGVYGIQADVSGCDAQRLADFSFMLAGDCPVSDYDKWVNPPERIESSRTEIEESAENDFCARMHKIEGFDRINTSQWFDRAWVLSGEVSANNGMPRELAYRAVLDEFADAFTLLDREYAESPAMLWGGKAVFTPQNLHDAAEWITNGGDLEDAQMLAEKGLPIQDGGQSDEDQAQGIALQ